MKLTEIPKWKYPIPFFLYSIFIRFELGLMILDKQQQHFNSYYSLVIIQRLRTHHGYAKKVTNAYESKYNSFI